MNELPLKNIKVIEFTHMVMGPSAGMILADLGAEVIKVEPIDGDKTRLLKGSGAGYFAMYNRNKQSICLDLKSEQGLEVINRLVEGADIVIENFRSGALDKLGLGYKQLSKINDQLIFMSAKGFLKGPYEHRTALDEVAQMMGGLAYMTGPSGKPLRAGASVIDVMGGMFGVIGILAALVQRPERQKGQHVTSSLFESTVFLMGQHMAQEVITGVAPNPMPERISAWAIYDVFEVKNNEKLFVAVVSDTQWKKFCVKFDLIEFIDKPELATNSQRVDQRNRIMTVVRERFLQLELSELMKNIEEIGLPYAPISRPQDLKSDEHLLASGGLLEVNLNDDSVAKLPALPIEFSGDRFGITRQIPHMGEHTEEILKSIGYSESEVLRMKQHQIAQ